MINLFVYLVFTRCVLLSVSGRADSPVMAEQAAHLAGMAFIPYYNQIMKILECDQSLKRTIVGKFLVIFPNNHHSREKSSHPAMF